jgi:FkbM family methyltransferase
MSQLIGRLAYANLALLERLLPRLSAGERSWMARRVMQRRHEPGVRAMAGFFNTCVLAWKNKQYDVDVNGEAATLARLRPFAPKILLDVGANVGDWSLAAAAALPEATIHAFEIAESTAAQLVARTAPLGGRVIANRFGLSDREGEVSIFISPESSTATSTRRDAIEIGAAEHGIRTIQEQTARVIPGDAYLAQAGIGHVDVLKIDVEGAEQAVLMGFDGAFARGAIDVVQFEYGAISVATRFLLADFHAFFEARGFVVGKILPEGVDFRPYTPADEDFAGPNFIACRRERADLVEALRGPPLLMG